MINFISLVIPTHNPHSGRLKRVLDALKPQTLSSADWELIIIDNNSDEPVQADLSWHPNAQIVAERQTGLTHARIKGFSVAKGDIIILADDDNVLDKDYLSQTLQIFREYPKVGATGGKVVPAFEVAPPKWLKDFYGNLALRDLGDEVIINEWKDTYPLAAPIGAGIAMRKVALENYINKIKTHKNPITDRQGKSLSSGGDNDIVLEIIKSGWQVGYFPSLSLQHIIPEERMQPEYLQRLVNGINKSWILLLESHNINPWKKIPAWSAPLRKLKAWFTYKAWQGKVNYIKWRGACGTYDGLANI